LGYVYIKLGLDKDWTAIVNVREKLSVSKTIRGGRLRASRLHIGQDIRIV